MTVYVGETLTITMKALDPVRGAAITDAAPQVNFYAPGKNPKSNPDDRTADHGPFAMTYDAEAALYVAEVATGGWVAGRWTYRVELGDAYESWEYASVPLKA